MYSGMKAEKGSFSALSSKVKLRSEANIRTEAPKQRKYLKIYSLYEDRQEIRAEGFAIGRAMGLGGLPDPNFLNFSLPG